MGHSLKLQVKNSLTELEIASENAARWMAAHQAPPAAEYLAHLALEELVTNCIKYGYDDANEHVIEVELELSPDELVIAVTDDGHPFNPLLSPEPNLDLPAEERKVGGLGLHLLRQMSTRMDYARVEGKNRVTLTKSLGSGAAG